MEYLGQLLDEVVRVCLLARLLDLLVSDAVTAKSNVLVDGAAEQDGLLTNDANPGKKNENNSEFYVFLENKYSETFISL